MSSEALQSFNYCFEDIRPLRTPKVVLVIVVTRFLHSYVFGSPAILSKGSATLRPSIARSLPLSDVTTHDTH